jgi:hypothetical protein
MKSCFAVLLAATVLLSCSTAPKSAKANPQAEAEQQPTRQAVPPEIVRSKNMRIANGLKILTMTNANGDYLLSCNLKAGESCITPEPRKNYLLFNRSTYWKLPGAKTFIDLAWLQDWTISYKEGENVALIPEDQSGGIGMYTVDAWNSSR